MEIQVLSDLHLESPKGYDEFQITAKAPFLALLGDIGQVEAHEQELLAFFRRQLSQFKVVFFVPGNHEAYTSTWVKTMSILHTFEREVRKINSIGEFVVLDRKAYQLPDTTTMILGCSLFSNVPPESEMAVEIGLQDFYQTDSWDIHSHNAAHARDLGWLNQEVGKLVIRHDIEKIVIFTHWSPCSDARAKDPRHAASPISAGFSTDLSDELCFGNKKVKLWAFGHTHFNCDFEVDRGNEAGKLRLFTNQRGYYFSQSAGFDGVAVVNI